MLIQRIEEPSLIRLTDAPKGIKGIVLAVGPGKRDEDGDLVPLDVKPGDKVLFNSKWNDLAASCNVGTGADGSGPLERPLPLGADPTLHLVQEADIFGIIPDLRLQASIKPGKLQQEYMQHVEVKPPISANAIDRATGKRF